MVYLNNAQAKLVGGLLKVAINEQVAKEQNAEVKKALESTRDAVVNEFMSFCRHTNPSFNAQAFIEYISKK